MRKHIYCYAHTQMMEARALALNLPALEDANAIQISLMRVQKALIDDTITAKKAGLLLYSLQLAATNIGQTTFGEAEERELVTELVDEQEALNQNQDLPLIDTEDAEDTDTSSLPRINTDERGLEQDGIPNVVRMRCEAEVMNSALGQTHANWDDVG